MDTNEELRVATDALTAEVHALGERLSAKEILHRRTRRLTILVGVGTLVSVIALVLVYSVVRSNKDTNAYWSGCLSRWGVASSERSEIIAGASELRDEKQGAKDRALRTLVDYRGDPSNAATDRAKAAYAAADDAAIEAEVKLQTLREMYPPPQIEDFCTRMKGAALDPKGQGE